MSPLLDTVLVYTSIYVQPRIGNVLWHWSGIKVDLCSQITFWGLVYLENSAQAKNVLPQRGRGRGGLNPLPRYFIFSPFFFAKQPYQYEYMFAVWTMAVIPTSVNTWNLLSLTIFAIAEMNWWLLIFLFCPVCCVCSLDNRSSFDYAIHWLAEGS